MKNRIVILMLIFSALNGAAQTFTSTSYSPPYEGGVGGGSDLCLLQLSHYDFDGREHVGEMVCNKAIAQDLIDIFHALYEAKYPIASMRPIDEYNNDDEASMADNNTSCYCHRNIAGTRILSKHATGMAVDINPLMNPCVHQKTGRVEPAAGRKYATNRKGRGVIDRNDLCYRLFTQHGFRWGGAWKTKKDYQHFEK